MRNLLPHFVQQQYLAGCCGGQLTAATMFVDISGFTAMTEALMRHGQEGAEVLSAALNRVLGPTVAAIYARGGFISTFAGDAFTAIFGDAMSGLARENSATWQALACAEEIQAIFRRRGRQRGRFGEFTLGIKIGLGKGEVEWGIAGGTDKEYFFRGAAIDGCAAAEHHAHQGEIVMTAEVAGQVDVGTEAVGTKYSRLDGPVGAVPRPVLERRPRLRKAVATRFLPPGVIEFDQAGEFRNVAVVFISFAGIATPAEMDAFVTTLTEQAWHLGGYLNKVDFGDKGGVALCLFGAPVAYENNVERALDFVLAVRQDLAGPRHLPALAWRAGLSYGTVYAGIIGGRQRCEYTAIGDTVNLAARLMGRAGWGEIWAAEGIRPAAERYDLAFLGNFRFKGQAEARPAYLLRGKQRAERTFAGQFVGRTGEVEQMETALARIAAGHGGSVVYLYGEPGMGKSRLAHELRQAHPELEWAYLPCDGVLRKPFNPLLYFFGRFFDQSTERDEAGNRASFERVYSELLAPAALPHRPKPSPTAAEIEEQGTQVREELVRLRSILAGFLGLYDPGSLYEQLDARLRYQNTLYAFQAIFQALALRRPLVVQVDDLHWIDPDSLEALGTIARRMAGSPVLFLVCSRYAEDGSRPVLPGVAPAAVIDLAQLSPRSVEDLVNALFGGRPSPHLLAHLQARTQGNPFFLEQTVQYYRETGIVAPVDGPAGEWEITRAEESLPATVNDLLVARVDRLGPRLKEVVQTAAVLGQEFEVRVLGQVLPEVVQEISSAEIDDQLRSGCDERIWSALAELRYLFSHALLREAAYRMQLQQRLRRLHQAAGAAMERIFAGEEPRCADLAFHYERAEAWDKALEYRQRAGEHASQTYAIEAAIAHFQRALELLPAGTEQRPRQIAIYRSLGYALFRHARYAEAIDAYAVMRQIAEESGDLSAQAEAWNGIGHAQATQGENRAAVESAARGEAIARAVGAGERLVYALYYKGFALYRMGDAAAALALAEEMLTLTRELGLPTAQARGLNLLSSAHDMLGHYQEAERYGQEALALFRAAGARGEIGTMLNNLGATAEARGDYRAAAALYSEALVAGREIGIRNEMLMYQSNLGGAQVGLGEHQEAEATLRQVIRAGRWFGLAETYHYLAEALLAQGKVAEALLAACQSLELGHEAESQEYIGTAWRTLGGIAAQQPDPIEVRGARYDAAACFAESRCVFQTIEAEGEEARALRDWGRYELEHGNPARGETLWQEAREMFLRLGMELEVRRMDEGK